MTGPRIDPAVLSAPLSAPARTVARQSGAFADSLREAVGGLRFSSHASTRLEQRGLSLSGDQMRRLEGGVSAAAQKGSRSALVMVDQVAMIVAVPARTVVTAVDAGQPGVFTNIDAAVVA